MGDKTLKELPQVGSGQAGEFHPSFVEGRPVDSGGDTRPFEVKATNSREEERAPDQSKTAWDPAEGHTALLGMATHPRTEGIGNSAHLCMRRGSLGSDIGQTKEFLRTMMAKRKLRVDVEDVQNLRAASAPVSPVGNVSCIDLTWCEEEATFKRFKSIGGTSGGKGIIRTSSELLATNIRIIIKKIANEATDLLAPALERNTKREIKEISARLNSLTSQIMTAEAQALLQTMGRYTMHANEPPATQTDLVENEIARLQDKIEQQDRAMKALEERTVRMEAEKGNAVTELERLKAENNALRRAVGKNSGTITLEALESVGGDADYELLEKKDWPDKIYRAAFMATGHPLKAMGLDLLVTTSRGSMDGSSPVNEVMYKTFTERHPELEGMDGRLTMLTVTTKTEDAEGIRTTERWILRAILAGMAYWKV